MKKRAHWVLFFVHCKQKKLSSFLNLARVICYNCAKH
nr:MAG TPA: hypothetical protein [Caudoviricetes sp.]